MCDEDKSVSIAVNGEQVRSSGHRRAVSRVMLVMRNVCALGKLGGCSEEASWDGVHWGACEWACQASETRRVRTTVRQRVGDGAGGQQGDARGLDGVRLACL
jgi:hypothetical protein